MIPAAVYTATSVLSTIHRCPECGSWTCAPWAQRTIHPCWALRRAARTEGAA